MVPSKKLVSVGALLMLTLAACGEAGSSGGTGATPSQTVTASLAACAPLAGDRLVVLDDDKKLQTVDNIIPAINAAAAQPAMIAALDAASAVLDTPTLVGLNKEVDVDRQTSSQAAKAFVESADLKIDASSGSGKVVIGAANFSESATLAEIYAEALRTAGYDATVRTIGNRETYLPALQKGELTVVPEYVGTLTEFLNKKANGADAAPLASGDLAATTKALTDLGKDAGLVFGAPAAAADQNAFAVTTAFAEEHGVATLSELAATCGGIILGGPPECPERPFCQPGLVGTYGLEVTEFTSLDAGGPLTKSALQKGEIALGLVFSSDAAFATTG
ncbi:MAG: glycine betaine ABC transporter substrate-binding protein [Candidatus Nanopelagicales bacterium]